MCGEDRLLVPLEMMCAAGLPLTLSQSHTKAFLSPWPLSKLLELPDGVLKSFAGNAMVLVVGSVIMYTMVMSDWRGVETAREVAAAAGV